MEIASRARKRNIMDIKKIVTIGKDVVAVVALVATGATATGWINGEVKKGVEKRVNNVRDTVKK